MGGQGVAAEHGSRIVQELIRAIQKNRQHLSDLDGAIGDGDHGVNMSKGFTRAGDELARNPGDLSHALGTVSRTLLTAIGGALGPLYGMMFRGLSKGCAELHWIDAQVFGRMLEAAEADVRKVSQAREGDKTLMDAFLPAVRAYSAALASGRDFAESLQALARAAEEGRDSTRDLVAKLGRASRLGERSRGTLDAGAASCALLLRTLADAIGQLLAAPTAEG
jgi:dihydroxyacetone kinase phosphoprotein-dependent L subunit